MGGDPVSVNFTPPSNDGRHIWEQVFVKAMEDGYSPDAARDFANSAHDAWLKRFGLEQTLSPRYQRGGLLQEIECSSAAAPPRKEPAER